MKKFLIALLVLAIAVPSAYATLLPDNYTLADLETDLSDVTVGTILVSTAAADAAASVKIVANGIEFEGATANAFETQVTATDPTADRAIVLPDLAGTVQLSGNPHSATTYISTSTGTVGWSVVAGANTACSTTCVAGCGFGVNTAATEADIVDCADATADECLCLGAS